MSSVASLNAPQREAVHAPDGPVLVLAGAGSGKTRVLTHRIEHLVRERGVRVDEILAITFTNKAAGEMRERLAALLGAPARQLWASTFHSACVRMLRIEAERAGYERGFTIFDDADQLRLMRSVIEDEGLDTKRYAPRAALGWVSERKNRLVGPEAAGRESASFADEVFAGCYRRYQDRLLVNQAMDFDDLIMVAVGLLERDAEVRARWQRRFRHVLVDEYQDTNHAQYRLVRVLAEPERNVTVVGDDDQSIYSWRGADIRNILDFERDFPDATVVALEQNYRSTGTILDAAHAVVSRIPGRHPKRLWTDRGPGEPITLVGHRDEYDEARHVVREVRRADAEGIGRAGIAVFYRTNAQSRVIEDMLVRERIAYQVVGGTRFYERAEVKDLMSYLQVVANPGNRLAFGRAAGAPRRGLGPACLTKLAARADTQGVPLDAAAREPDLIPGLSAAQRAALRALGGLLADLRTLDAAGAPVDRVVEAALERSGLRDALAAEGPAEAGLGRLENLQELIGVAAEYQAQAEEPSLSGFLEELALASDADEVEQGTEQVTLMTIHNAKGLEFDVVVIAGLEERLFPHARSLEDPDALEEERRLFYVGITRARRRLVLSHADSRAMRGSRDYTVPSSFLRDIPAETLGRPERPPRAPSAAPRPPAGRPAAPRARGGEPALRLETGDQVVHATFGEGVVVGTQQRGRLLQVRFQDKERLLMADMAPMRKAAG